MTRREEAILGLKELRDWEGLPYCIEEPMQREGVVVITQEVIDMAIQALEQQPTLDTRQRERQLEMEYQHGYDKGWEEGRKAFEAQPTDEIKEAYLKGYDYGVKDWFKAKTQPCEDAVSRDQVEEITFQEPSYTHTRKTKGKVDGMWWG